MATDRTFSQPNGFAARNASHLSADVIGRSVEFSALAKFLQSAGVQPSGLVIEGEAGIGKTTLMAGRGGAGSRTRISGAVARILDRTKLGLPARHLQDLLGGVDPAVPTRLPGVQRIAVDRVLLRATSEGTPTDERVVAAALVSVVRPWLRRP